MAKHVCPWWLGYWLICPVRRLFQNPRTILEPLVRPGFTALDIGCGMGYFTLPLADLVGLEGKVVAVDLQERMLRSLQKRAAKAGVSDRIVPHQCRADSLGLDEYRGKIDFALAFAVVHEVPDARAMLAELAGALKPGAKLLLAEPAKHVSAEAFAKTIQAAKESGFEETQSPKIALANARLLTKTP